AEIDDDETECLAAQRRGRRKDETRAARAHHDEPLEIDARTLPGKRIERRRRIDPGRHPTLRLRGGGRTEGELELSNTRRTDERDGLARDKPAANDTIESRFGRHEKLAAMALTCTAARNSMYAKASFDARDSTGQSIRRHIAPLERSRIVRFSPPLATFRLLERMF